MICFHFIIFVLSGTATDCIILCSRQLWFAFISLSLCYQGQLQITREIGKHRCDLLSFHYLCAIRDSTKSTAHGSLIVVICFHFIIFVLSGTASDNSYIRVILLWFAFISLSLCYQGQPFYPNVLRINSCDLLSFHFIIFVLSGTASRWVWYYPYWVVICFHFIIFVLSGTANYRHWATMWSCDLLSFHYLCAIRDSCYSLKDSL